MPFLSTPAATHDTRSVSDTSEAPGGARQCHQYNRLVLANIDNRRFGLIAWCGWANPSLWSQSKACIRKKRVLVKSAYLSKAEEKTHGL